MCYNTNNAVEKYNWKKYSTMGFVCFKNVQSTIVEFKIVIVNLHSNILTYIVSDRVVMVSHVHRYT